MGYFLHSVVESICQFILCGVKVNWMASNVCFYNFILHSPDYCKIWLGNLVCFNWFLLIMAYLTLETNSKEKSGMCPGRGTLRFIDDNKRSRAAKCASFYDVWCGSVGQLVVLLDLNQNRIPSPLL